MEQRLYTSRDMVRVQNPNCEGCGACCRDMGDSIVLDPYDVCMMTHHLGRSFSEMNGNEIGLHVDRGMILPHLNMKKIESTGSNDADNVLACSFLNEDGRCSIHAFRPGLCRLFPLGRDYDGTGFRYFVVEDACPKPGKSKVRVEQWLGVTDLKQYEAFISSWHYFVRQAQETLAAIEDPEYQQRLNLFFLQVFYATPYSPVEDFYHLFEMRLEQARSVLS